MLNQSGVDSTSITTIELGTNYIAPVLLLSDDPVEPAVNFLSSALRLLLEPNSIPVRMANAPAARPYINISSLIFSLSNMPS